MASFSNTIRKDINFMDDSIEKLRLSPLGFGDKPSLSYVSCCKVQGS